MLDQKRFFDGLGFEELEMKYESGNETCFKGPDGAYYRVDHFSNLYVIEYAENEEDAKLNRFEDADTYEDSLTEEEIISAIQADLMNYATE